jgi:hypothetical protein
VTPLVKSPRVRARLLLATTALFAVMAILSWWTVAEDGPSPARVIAAIATTAGAVIQAVVWARGGGGRRVRG